MNQRIDVLLVERGLCETRERAQRACLAGVVYSGGRRLDKPGMKVDDSIPLELRGSDCPYVSRGGLKLEKALRYFAIDVSGEVALDVGASTGGFTDCLLQSGAVLVYSVDVGYGQLAWKLREDPRVKVFERMNARELDPGLFDPLPRLAVVDVSFISLRKVLPGVLRCLEGDGPVITLIKPQFEAGRERVGKKGVVRDPATHRDVIAQVVVDLGALGLRLDGLTASPIRGPEGNIEFLSIWRRGQPSALSPEMVAHVVDEAHADRGGGTGGGRAE